MQYPNRIICLVIVFRPLVIGAVTSDENSCGLSLIHFDGHLLKKAKDLTRPNSSERGPWWGRMKKWAASATTPSADENGSPYRETLKNIHDMFYTSKINIGGQDIDVIPDTGSFDGVIFGSDCNSCGPPKLLYDSSDSNTFANGNVTAHVEYGSGSLENVAAFDTVRLEDSDLEAKQLLFWVTTTANMPVAADPSFSGILGLGPPTSAVKFAMYAYEDSKRSAQEMAESGYAEPGMNRTVRQLGLALDLIKKNPQWLTKLQVKSLSFCLQKGAGDPGYLIYNDAINAFPQGVFQEIQVLGDYWSASLSQINFVGVGTTEGASSIHLGCRESPCSAVLDTGTSLIAVPTDIFSRVTDFAQRWTKKHGCDDLSTWPDLDLMLDGKKITLPPSSYMGKMTGQVQGSVARVMPHLSNFLPWNTSDLSFPRTVSDADPPCVPLLMDIGGIVESGTVILGLPFFRHYYTSFVLADDLVNAKSMFIANNDDSTGQCQPATAEYAATWRHTRSKQDITPLIVDASKIRPPRSGAIPASILRSRI